MKPTYHLYGLRITLDGDLEEAARRAHLAQKLMFQTKMLNVNNLDIIQDNLRLSDGTHVHVMSQHGLDSAQIYVPPKPGVTAPGKKRRVEQFIWPAIEMYYPRAGSTWIGDFAGVVLCKGGGFDPPYEFIPADQMPEQALPEDTSSIPAGDLPEERFWTGIPIYPNCVDRSFEDIQPVGVGVSEIVSGSAPTGGFSGSYNLQGAISRGEATPRQIGDSVFTSPPYASILPPEGWTEYDAWARLLYNADYSSHFSRDYSIGFYYEDVGLPDDYLWWNTFPYVSTNFHYQINPGQRRDHVLSLGGSFSESMSGIETSTFLFTSEKSAYDDGLIFVPDDSLVGGRYEVDPGASMAKVTAEAETAALADVFTFQDREHPMGYTGENYSKNMHFTGSRISQEEAVILNEREFAAVFSTAERNDYQTATGSIADWWACSQGFGRLYYDCQDEYSSSGIAVGYKGNNLGSEVHFNGQVVGSLAGSLPYSSYLSKKYFKVSDDKSLALFFMDCRGNGDLSFLYVDEDGIIQTMVND